MDIIKIAGTGFASNTYIIVAGSNVAVVDPSAELTTILAEIGNRTLSYILLTHGHFDHILCLDSLKEHTNAKVYIHKNDADMLQDTSLNASNWFGMNFFAQCADYTLADNDILQLDNEEIKVISTPGHTPGSVCFDCGDFIICGDTLFSNSYGRYDLPGGNPHVLFSSLQKLAQIKCDPMIHPGHGASCALSDADIIRAIRKNNF